MSNFWLRLYSHIAKGNISRVFQSKPYQVPQHYPNFVSRHIVKKYLQIVLALGISMLLNVSDEQTLIMILEQEHKSRQNVTRLSFSIR